MQNPNVSIIVPCYKVEKYLDRCMESLLSQTLKDIEIIMVDDGSPDRVPLMVDDYAKKDSRIKVIHKKNEGLGFARNSGLDIATGEYLAFVDSDDFVELDMYETLYNEAINSDADVVYSNFFTEGQPGKWQKNQEVNERMEWKYDSVKDFMLDMVATTPSDKYERRFQMSVWHSIYKRSIIEDNNIRFHSEREVSSEDFPFQLDFLLNANTIVFLPDAFYHYCANDTSLTATFNPDKFRRIRNLFDLMCCQLGDIEGAQLRLDKFYLGYVRNRIYELVLSDCKEKISILNNVMNDEIILQIKDRYPISSLPIYPRLFSFLLLNRHRASLILLVYIQAYIKTHMGYRA